MNKNRPHKASLKVLGYEFKEGKDQGENLGEGEQKKQ